MPTPRLTIPRHRVGMHQAIGGKIFVPLPTVDSGYDCNRGDPAVGYRDRANLDDFVDLSMPLPPVGCALPWKTSAVGFRPSTRTS